MSPCCFGKKCSAHLFQSRPVLPAAVVVAVWSHGECVGDQPNQDSHPFSLLWFAVGQNESHCRRVKGDSSVT